MLKNVTDGAISLLLQNLTSEVGCKNGFEMFVSMQSIGHMIIFFIFPQNFGAKPWMKIDISQLWCLPPAPTLICLLAPFTVFNLVKLGLALSSEDSVARNYFILSSIIWLLILPPWLASLVSRLQISYPCQSSILNLLNRTTWWLNTHCCNIDVYSCTEIFWFLLHLFQILLALGSASRVNMQHLHHKHRHHG